MWGTSDGGRWRRTAIRSPTSPTSSPLDRIAGLLERTGLVVTARLEEAPTGPAGRTYAYLLVRRPAR
ncbi:hypothetical protein [Streptomyces lavendulocolor]|uniref:hypothetical protein n=1 Tax=Streptomyces lavendulocolor TaxID=67316 RepID=UPI003F4CD171